jgi:hypothetical protein
MKYTIRNLSVLAYAQGFTLWHYKLMGQTLVDTTIPGFWNNGVFAVGDIIMISGAAGARQICITSTNGDVSWENVK